VLARKLAMTRKEGRQAGRDKGKEAGYVVIIKWKYSHLAGREKI